MATDSPATRIALRITVLYLAGGMLWILASDAVTAFLARSSSDLLYWQLLKGWLFILTTAAILYGVIHHYVHQYHRKESHFRALVEATSNYVWITGAEGAVVSNTDVFQEMTGIHPDQSQTAGWVDVLHPDDCEGVLAGWQHALTTGQKFETEFRMLTTKGDYRYFQCRAVPIHDGGRIQQWIGHTVDINDRKTALLELETSAANLRLAMRGGKLGLWGWDLTSNRIEYSLQWKQQLGFDPDEDVDTSLDFYLHLLHPDDFKPLLKKWQHALETIDQNFETEYRMRHCNGDYRWFHAEASFLTDDTGKPVRIMGTHLDITDIKENQEQLRYLATHDDLLGLPNRRMKAEKLHAFIRDAKERQEKVGLVQLNLDHFKLVSNNFGSEWGNELLRACANRVASIVPPQYFLCRPGSDELAVIVRDRHNGKDIDSFAKNLHRLFDSPFKIFDHELFISCTVGVAVFPDHASDGDELIRKTHATLDYGKLLGRNRIQYFNEHIDSQSTRMHQIQNGLRLALAHDELDIVLQPQYDAKSLEPRGFEALLRWHNGALGDVSPGEFIPVAESSGLIDRLGLFVLERSCQQLARWRQEQLVDTCIALNISAGQLHHPHFVRDMIAMLRKYGLQPEQLELEITETAMMADVDTSMSALRRLTAAGFRLAIDDFGTGYSSFAYLRSLKVEALKIDKTFIDQIGHSEADDMIVSAIIALAHNLQLRVVAEGVETAEQLVFLQENGCDVVQGYYLCRPVAIGEATVLLRQN